MEQSNNTTEQSQKMHKTYSVLKSTILKNGKNKSSIAFIPSESPYYLVNLLFASASIKDSITEIYPFACRRAGIVVASLYQRAKKAHAQTPEDESIFAAKQCLKLFINKTYTKTKQGQNLYLNSRSCADVAKSILFVLNKCSDKSAKETIE